MDITDITIMEYLQIIGKGEILPPDADELKDTKIIAPWNSEKTPSCIIKEGYFKDYSSGAKGGIIAFASLCVIGRIDMRVGAKELYEKFPHLSNNKDNDNYNNRQTTNYYKPQNISSNKDNYSNKPKIINIGHLFTYFLKDYITSRNIRLDIAMKYINEVKYEVKGKQYKAIGFKNDSGNYVLRNKYIKMNLGKSDITTIIEDDVAYIVLNSVTHATKGIIEAKKHSTSVIFEGFFDFLSYMAIRRKKPLQGVCSLFLDNDISGDIATSDFKREMPFTHDYRHVYSHHGDLNSFICNPKVKEFEERETVRYNMANKVYEIMKGNEIVFKTKYKTHIKKMMGELKND